jgi:hypothetical protein
MLFSTILLCFPASVANIPVSLVFKNTFNAQLQRIPTSTAGKKLGKNGAVQQNCFLSLCAPSEHFKVHTITAQ